MPAIVPGDANGDGQITVLDVLEVLLTSVGSGECSPCVCDVNGDGEVTVSDGAILLQVAVGRDIATMPSDCL